MNLPHGPRRLVFRVGGLVMIIGGLAALAAAAFLVYERARSGADADRFNNEVSPGDRAALLGESASPVPAAVYPGAWVNPKYWDEPLWAGPEPYGSAGLPDGFDAVSARDTLTVPVAGSHALRMRVPAIGLDSGVAPLEIIDAGDQRLYETPVNTVGFIPDTALPGAPSEGWYFGHLESVVRGEGSEFRRLPEIADLIREDPVDIFLSTGPVEYLYRVTGTEQVKEEDLRITSGPDPGITLVTCWPPRVYDRRVLVHAELIGIKRDIFTTPS